MHRKLWLVLVLATLTLVASGCRKKAPVTPAEMAPQTVAAAAPAAKTLPPPPAPASDPDPWSGNLESVNRYARELGLLGDVYFDYDRYELRKDALDQLATNARFLKEYPQFVVTIEGHCDERGTNEYNLALGESRASSTTHFLRNIGVDHQRLQTVSYGKERPVCVDSGEDCWWKNRRAHFVITGRTGSRAG